MQADEVDRAPRLAAGGVKAEDPILPHAFHLTGDLDKVRRSATEFPLPR